MPYANALGTLCELTCCTSCPDAVELMYLDCRALPTYPSSAHGMKKPEYAAVSAATTHGSGKAQKSFSTGQHDSRILVGAFIGYAMSYFDRRALPVI